jgi:RNA polymerase sigma factor (sigma-70 family)
MEITEEELQALRERLLFKVRYHVGYWSPDAEDIVQETIARLLRAAGENGIRNPSSWAAFASATCNNVIHEHRRSFWRETPADENTPQGSSDSHAAITEAREAVARALPLLTTRDRDLLRAFYLDEKSPEEICCNMSLTPGSFRVALFRARERFRRILYPEVKSSAAE